MTARVRPISSASNAGQYFYFTERNYECNKGWQQNDITKELGLEKITRESFENILSGKIKDGVHLGRMTQDGLKHHPGHEITFTAPKSLSIMALVAGDKRLLEAHEKAVSETLEYMNRHLIYARVQKDGLKYQEKTDNTIAAKFTHITSRAVKDAGNDKKPDPGLHTHALVANATKCKDGEFRSVVFDKLYENQLNISELYNINLARESKSLGYDLNEGKTSAGRYTFEIKGVSDKDIKEFSQRRNNIMEVAGQTGVSDVKGIEYIAKSTRAEKIKETQEELLKNWLSRTNAKELNSVKDEALANKILGHKLSTNLEDNLSFAISHLSEREAVWEATELHKIIWQKAPLDYTIKDIEKVIAANITNNKVLTAYDENNGSYTTKSNLRLEKEVVKLVQNGQNKSYSIAREQRVNTALEGSSLTLGQKDSAKLILTSKDKVVGVQGTAGTGKTTMLKQVKDIAGENGIELLGLAPTKSASDVLGKAVGIDGKTLKSFTMKYEGVAKGRGTKEGIASMREELANKLVILDEASLASSKEMKNLLTVSDRLGFKIAMIGDAKQQHGIEAGKPFYYLQDHGMNTSIQRDIKRQEAGSDLLKAVYQSEKAVDSEFASKSIYQALKAVGNNNIKDVSELKKEEAVTENKEVAPVVNKDLAKAAYGSWKQLKDKSNEILVVAPSNDLRDKISASMRKHYIKGESESTLVYTNTYKTKAEISDLRCYNGQEIVSFEKDIKSLGIKAGDIFEIDKINHKELEKNDKSIGDKSDKGNIDLIRISDNKKISWNPVSKNEFVALYDSKYIDIAKGEKVRWTKNSKKHSFMTNGETAIIESVGKQKIGIRTADGVEHKVSREEMRFMDYGYTASTYSSQGKTSDYAIGVVRAKERFATLSHQRSFYVTLSRAAKEAHLVIDNYKDLIKSLGEKDGDKTSSIEHQTKLDKNTSVVKDRTNPEAKIRANAIKSIIEKLAIEYKNIEKLKPSNESLSASMKESIADLKSTQVDVNKLADNFIKNSGYQNPHDALSKWNELANNFGLNKAREVVENNPQKLGELLGKKVLLFNNKNRKDAIAKAKDSVNTLTSYAVAKDNLKVNKISVDNLDKKYAEVHKNCLGFKTKDITYSKFKKNIEEAVKKSLWQIDNIDSKNIISAISKRVEEQIIEYKARYKKEPNLSVKSQMFSKAKYEYEKKNFYIEKLNRENTAKTKLDKVKQYQKADQLTKIESNQLKQEHHKSFETLDQKALVNSFNYYSERASNLANSYIKQGYNKSQAENIANKIVDYELVNNKHASINNLKVIETESKTFNLDKTIIKNMGINEKDSSCIIGKIETIESQKLNSKDKIELGFTTSTKPITTKESITKSKVIEQDKTQEIGKTIDTGFSI